MARLLTCIAAGFFIGSLVGMIVGKFIFGHDVSLITGIGVIIGGVIGKWLGDAKYPRPSHSKLDNQKLYFGINGVTPKYNPEFWDITLDHKRFNDLRSRKDTLKEHEKEELKWRERQKIKRMMRK